MNFSQAPNKDTDAVPWASPCLLPSVSLPEIRVWSGDGHHRYASLLQQQPSRSQALLSYFSLVNPSIP